MKPVYLEFSGINSFSETAKIDFKTLLSGGVFGIFGDTGSGKSTILDSIHFALYGEIDRVPKSFNDCINYRSEGANVTFDFELSFGGARKTYRVKRERKRKSGTTKAYLYEYTPNGGLFPLAEGARDVDEKIEQILGLSFADFKTCIALPQGDFAALVKATPSDRVRLVARLFNLDKYGEKLSRAVNERYYKAEEEVNLVKAKMGENEGASEEKLRETDEAVASARQALAAYEQAYQQAEKAYVSAQETAKAKEHHAALCEKLEKLTARLPQMQEKQAKLSLLPSARAVVEKDLAWQSAKQEQAQAEENATLAQKAYALAQAKSKQAQTDYERENYDEKILKLTVNLQRVTDAQTDIAAERQAKQALNDCIEEYNALKNKCPFEDFAAKKQEIEAKIDALGEDGTLLDYLKRNYKGVLLPDVYGEIRADLSKLAEKHPQIAADIQPLLQKYASAQEAGETAFDITTVQRAFKEIEEQRKALRDEYAKVEKRRLAYEENESAKKTLTERGRRLREDYNAAQEKIARVKDMGSLETLSEQMEQLKTDRETAKTKADKAKDELSSCYAEQEKCAGLASLRKQTTEKCKLTLASTLKETGFESTAAANELISLFGEAQDAQAAQADCNAFFEELAAVKGELSKTDKAKFADFDETALQAAEEKKQAARLALDEKNKDLGALEKERQRLQQLREKYKEQEKELAEKERCKNLCDELRSLVRNNKFLEFIASEYLQEICVNASKTLLSLTGGRYFLRYEKEFKVGDNLDGGNLRGVKTLSGGETFLVSLSLALSLSAAICLKSLRPIEFFFLDEGFGTLDERLVDTVMDVLGKLSRSFCVGLISHVEELKHRIEHKILVNGATETHGSTVKLETF